MTQLVGKAIARVDLQDVDITAMFTLFHEYYEQSSLDIFRRDLRNKNWVIHLYDTEGNLQGFTTFALYETQVDGEKMSAVFSGDTIIRNAFWSSPELPRIWIKTVLDLSRAIAQPLYWFLISSGYKTYRFLPVFYKDFYPRYDQPTPPKIQRIMDTLATERFGDEYDPARGIVRFRQGATPLRAGVAEITEERLRDSHIAFFVSRNPGHARGDELVCLTQIHSDNYTAAGHRIMRSLEQHG